MWCPTIQGSFTHDRPLLISLEPCGGLGYSRCELSDTITQHGDTPRLVECQPVFDSVTVSLKAEFGISSVIFDDVSREPSFVSLMQGEWKIPADV